jgi:hypothetical protein
MTRAHLALILFLAAAPAGLLLPAPPAAAGDADCKAVIDAVIKQAGVPVHQKVTIESAQAPGRKIESEVIRIGDALYMQMRGHWMKRPYDAAKAMADAQEAMRKSSHTCSLVRREAIDGQAADLYKVHTEGPEGVTDGEVWISAASGLPLRQRTEMSAQGLSKSRHEVVFDYANVKAPAQ